ncbi:hypothetical protein [Allorhodopirellula heiligendammensis]|uniref:hypothetical protein n=1 Tax=Allorhodopirellula heiligendammensis TaxID=2714739 RepID=UPI00265E6C2E|nr:hypothetical protein [Allorhodopirellula heiligendammensis]
MSCETIGNDMQSAIEGNYFLPVPIQPSGVMGENAETFIGAVRQINANAVGMQQIY